MIKPRLRQHFGPYQVIDSEIFTDRLHCKKVLCYNSKKNNLLYVPISRLENLDEIREQANIKYHEGKPHTLEYYKTYNKEYYHNNKKYRKDRIAQMRKYYQDNPEYFKAHRQSEERKAYIKERAKTPEYKAYMKEYRKKNRKNITKKTREYYLNNPEKKLAKNNQSRLYSINRLRLKKGLQPVNDIETHLQQRKEEWYKRLTYPHLYKDSK